MSIKISDICDINSSNISSKDNYEFINYLDTSNLTEGVIDTLQKLVVGEDKIPSRAKRKVKKNDVLISTVRPNQKHYGILRKLKENLIVSTGFVVLSAKEDIVDAEYLYRYLTQDSITNYLQAIGETSTSAYPSIKPSDIGSLEIELPQLEEQKAIAKVLLDLDKKIEINNKINKKLEEMAQAIFKQWFVDFEFPNEDGKPYKSSGGEMVESELGMIPKGWSYTNIENVVSSANTGADAIRRAPIVDYDTGIKCVRVGDMSNKRDISSWAYCEVNDEDYKKFSLKKNDILVTRTATIGLNTFIFEDLKAVYNNGLIRLKVKEDFNPIYIYQVMNHKDFMEHISKITGETSTRPNMKINYLLKYKFILPEKDIRDKFEKIINPILNKINSNNHENEKLAISRDTLLPKLISGEIRVPID